MGAASYAGMNNDPRPCTRCQGSGLREDGTRCWTCKGSKTYPEPDLDAILALVTTKGKVKRFRKSWPDTSGRFGDLTTGRAYYCWRMARFHGGVDVTMPFTANLVVRGDPWVKELDLIAERIASHAFGTDMAGAYRWAQALGYADSAPDGLPATAYPGGPVVTESKPDFEAEDLV